jgi:hypothetical protein
MLAFGELPKPQQVLFRTTLYTEPFFPLSSTGLLFVGVDF